MANELFFQTSDITWLNTPSCNIYGERVILPVCVGQYKYTDRKFRAFSREEDLKSQLQSADDGRSPNLIVASATGVIQVYI